MKRTPDKWTGRHIVALRQAMRLGRDGFADHAGVSSEAVRKWERRGSGISLSAPYADRMDKVVLGLNEVAAERFWSLLDESESAEGADRRAEPVIPEPSAISTLSLLVGGANESLGGHTGSTEFVLRTPAGRAFSGSRVPALVIPAYESEGRVLAAPARVQDPLRTRRGLLVAVVDDEFGSRRYGLDTRRAQARMMASNVGAPLLIPDAYQLDDLTLALVWAVTNLDDDVLDDDADLAAASARIGHVESRSSSAIREMAAGLSVPSQMWLGSDFCARHILRYASSLGSRPAYWSREQRGEEASTWLLFAHKLTYLRTAAPGSTRTFCVPVMEVSRSSVGERMLFLLAAALIESAGTEIVVCTEPEYTSVPGFVLDAGAGRAVVASWINTDHLWATDVTDHRPTLREYRDAHRWARNHTVAVGITPHRRLQGLADYLGLDWSWIARRCRQLDDYGVEGLVRPRSRLLSLSGLEQAIHFVATSNV